MRRRIRSRPASLESRTSKDLDIEVFGIPQDKLQALLQSLGKVVPAGQAFPVYKLGDVDVALPRRESKTGRGHKGFTVEGDPSMPFDEAARRRDFTINAIGWDPLTDEYLDPFNGREDLRAPHPAGRRSEDVCATIRCACCARCSSRHGSS